ncbi:MAG: FliM/FliN family flagellar motor C-terminal domain-containing protein [Sulfitobacter sp.]
MSAEQITSLLQRKARTGREAHAARAMSLGRALRLTAAKQADQLMGLAMGTLSVTQKAIASEQLEKQLMPDSLMLLMDGPGEQVAAAMLEPALVTGLIQQQTMGNVRPAPEQETARATTATDAALCAPFVEALMTRAAMMPESPRDRNLLEGYRFGVWARIPRQLLLALDAGAYEVVEMTLDLAAGTRSGKLVLILPEPVAEVQQVDDEATEEVPKRVVTTKLDKQVMELHADLTIALTRLKMPIQKVSSLKAGDVVDINLSSMAQALVIDANGKVITRGTLGQIDGIRALQVEQQNTNKNNEPRRRASDRDELDLPDVTAGQGGDPSGDEDDYDVDLPSLSDVDIFGDIDDLPDMPDMDELSAEADARMAARDSIGDGGQDRRENQAS